MSYTTNPQELFSGRIQALVESVEVPIQRPVRFEIEGEKGGTWTVDFVNKKVHEGTTDTPVSAIVKANALDFIALVEGRMSPADGLLTKRLSLTGSAATLTHLMEAISSATEAKKMP